MSDSPGTSEELFEILDRDGVRHVVVGGVGVVLHGHPHFTAGTSEWPVTWEAHRRDQIDSFRNSTPHQRLIWLEQALRIAHASGALARAETAEERKRRGL